MMNRRRFLSYGVSLSAAGLFIGCKPSEPSSLPTNNPPSDASPSSSHPMASSVMTMTEPDLNNLLHSPSDQKLLNAKHFPIGSVLPTLPLLTNQSKTSGKFVGRLVAKKHALELIQGFQTEFLLYNNVLGGPQIVLYEEDEVSILFINELDEATTVHFHGLPVPPSQDGNPHDAVKPGQARTYSFKLPKHCAGTYWYHTHAHGLSAEQAFRGLAGTCIVKSRQDALRTLPEQHWLFTDLRLDEQAQIPKNTTMDWINGREGQFVLINGMLKPTIQINEMTRIRVWNACNARYLRLHIPDCDLIVIGTDGGLLEMPQAPVSELLIVPAERYEIILKPHRTGSLTLQNLPYDRQKMMEPFEPNMMELANIQCQNDDVNLNALPQPLRQLPKLDAPVAEQMVSFSEEHDVALNQMFKVNGKVFDMNRVDLVSQLNATEDWLITNASHMDHPFHLHGTQFEIIEFIDSGESILPSYRCLKDTVNLKPYQSVRVRTKQEFKGLRMFHCHILEHEALGMMGQVEVR